MSITKENTNFEVLINYLDGKVFTHRLENILDVCNLFKRHLRFEINNEPCLKTVEIRELKKGNCLSFDCVLLSKIEFCQSLIIFFEGFLPTPSELQLHNSLQEHILLLHQIIDFYNKSIQPM